MSAADVLVIGSGIAGYGAALGAQSAGARVEVVSSHWGSTALVGGTWSCASPQFIARLAHAPLPPERVHEELVDQLKLYRHGSDVSVAATDAGTLVDAWALQRPVLDIGACRKMQLAVCGIPELPAFDSKMLADAFSQASTLRFGSESPEFVPVMLEPVPGAVPRTGSSLEVAEQYEQPHQKHVLLTQLEHLARDGFGAALLPPILGMLPADVADMQAATRLLIGELSVPLSGPQGLRLIHAIKGALSQASCPTVNAQVDSLSHSQAGFVLEHGQGCTTARSVVLASGRFFGNGLTQHHGSVVEPLSGKQVDRLDVANTLRGTFPGVHTGRISMAGGSFFAAGALLALCAREGLGACLLSGYYAGLAAAEEARGPHDAAPNQRPAPMA